MSRAVFSLILLLTGCAYIDGPGRISEVSNEMEAAETVEVNFDIGKLHSLKSAVSPNEDLIVDLNLLAYADGKLIDAEYYCGEINPSLKLLFGQKYNLYAIANVGVLEPQLDEGVFRNECRYLISGVGDLHESIPMAWRVEGYEVTTFGERVCIKLERLVAKLLFSIDKSALRGLEINSVRLRQSPNIVWPFKDEGSSAVDKEDVFDCDYASLDDLKTLNAGGQVHFYILENCQGILLQDNTDPWRKIPESISDKKEVCTYLEVGCTFKEGFFYSGNVTYRLYIGQDSVSDFNIRRNVVLNACLCLTDDALAQISWRVEADVSVNEGYADGWLSRGLHSIDDLYVGERFVYTLALADEMMTHLNGNPDNARLCVMDEEEHDSEIIRFGELRVVDSFDGRSQFEVEALCLHSACGTLCLKDANGKLLTVLDDFVVQKPLLMATESAPTGIYMTIEPDVPLIAFQINDEYYHCDLYLVDNDWRNLNTSLGCGFDVSLFDITIDVDIIDDEILNTLDFRTVRNDDLGKIATFYGRCVNESADRNLKTELMSKVTSGELGKLCFVEANHNISEELTFSFDYMPMTLTLVDNSWAGYADCQLSMIVDNPSGLPVAVNCWQLNRAKDTYNSIDRNVAVELYGDEYSRERYDYVCKSYSSNQLPLYCSGAVFEAYESGVYPMPELSVDLISYALLYDYMNQNALMHQVDVQFADGSPVNKLQIVNKLSDGSSKYNMMYGNDPDYGGLNDRGVWLYTSKRLLSKPGVDLDDVSGVDPLSLVDLAQLDGAKIIVAYNADNQNICASVNSSLLTGLRLNTEVVVDASGYVQTTPNGTWGKKVDNYCSAKVSKQVKNIVLSSVSTSIDGNAIKEAMNAIYNQTFIDSYNKVGSSNSYGHNAHPTSLDIALRFSIGDGNSKTIVPIVVNMSASTAFYHSQEQSTYSVSMNTMKKINKIAIVSNLIN